jgi:hypothetical protein
MRLDYNASNKGGHRNKMSNTIDQNQSETAKTQEDGNVEVKTGLKAGHWHEERVDRHHPDYDRHDYRHHRWW